MAKQTVGELIKEARTKAGLSQAALAGMIEGLSASELSKAERGEKELTQAELKAIAKATGVTQKSLLEAAAADAAKPAAKKPASGAAKKSESAAAQKPAASGAAKKPAAKKTESGAAKKPESAAVELTQAEKTMLNAWRKADAETRKAALRLLRGEKDEPKASDADDLLGTLLTGAMDMLGNLGKK